MTESIRFDLQFKDMVDDTIGEGIAFNPTTQSIESHSAAEVTSESLAGLLRMTTRMRSIQSRR